MLSPKRSLLLFSLSASGFRLSTPASILIGLALSFFRVSLSCLSIRLRFRLSLGRRPTRGLFPLLLFLAKRQHASVFRHLCGSTGCGADWRSSLFPLVVVLGTLQHVSRFHDAAVRVLLRSRSFRNRNGVSRLQQVQWNIRLGLGRRKLFHGNVDGVFLALEHIELGV